MLEQSKHKTVTAEIDEQAQDFKRVEHACTFARLAFTEALLVTAVMTKGQMKNDAVLTLQDTLEDVISLYSNGPEKKVEV